MSMLPGFALPEDLLCVSQDAEAGLPIDAITCALDRANSVLMLLEDHFTFRVGCIRPAITSTDKISRNRAMVVVIDFVHHDGVELAKPFVVVGL